MIDTTSLGIVVDTNESLPQHCGYRFAGDRVMHLDCADYSAIGLIDTLRIERKSLPDFLGCCGSRREAFECGTLAEMQVYTHRYLLIESSLRDIAAARWDRPRITASQAIGSLFAWQIDYGVRVVLADDAPHARASVVRIVHLLLNRAKKARKNVAEQRE